MLIKHQTLNPNRSMTTSKPLEEISSIHSDLLSKHHVVHQPLQRSTARLEKHSPFQPYALDPLTNTDLSRSTKISSDFKAFTRCDSQDQEHSTIPQRREPPKDGLSPRRGTVLVLMGEEGNAGMEVGN